jgi:fermentation-respiration switch protein FrsA (DUF1100 family)
MVRSLLKLLLFIALIYAGFCLVVWLAQSKLVWFPGSAPTRTPADAGLAYEDVTLRTDDGVELSAWWIPANEPAGAAIVCHGNAGNIAHRIPLAAALREMGLDVLLFDYRGYGNSDGSPSEEGTYLDAEAAWDHVVSQRGVLPSRLVLFGESLGSGVAVELATRREIAGLVLEGAFSSLPELGARLYPYLPVRLLARVRYDNAAKVGSLDRPLLMLHSPQDRVVPIELGRALYDAATDPKEFVETSGGHNDGGFLRSQAAQARLDAFVRSALAAGDG